MAEALGNIGKNYVNMNLGIAQSEMVKRMNAMAESFAPQKALVDSLASTKAIADSFVSTKVLTQSLTTSQMLEESVKTDEIAQKSWGVKQSLDVGFMESFQKQLEEYEEEINVDEEN
jgi:uncharacterized protein (DUF342 family)